MTAAAWPEGTPADFPRIVAALADDPDLGLTDEQRAQLWLLAREHVQRWLRTQEDDL